MRSAKVDPRILLHAAMSGWCLALLVTASILGFFAGSGWIVLAGVCSFAGAAVARSRAPAFRAHLRARDAERAAQLPRPETLRDEAVRRAVYAVDHARTELAEALRDTPPWLTEQATRTADAAGELVRLAAGVARHAQYIHAHLNRSGGRVARQELMALAEARARASDDAVARQLELALALRRRQVAALDELERSREEDLAAPARIVASLDAARARSLLLRTTRGGGGTRLGELRDGIDAIDDELVVSEHAALLLDEASAGAA